MDGVRWSWRQKRKEGRLYHDTCHCLLCCGSNTSISHMVCCHVYIIAFQAIEKVNLLLNCVPTRYCLPQPGQAPLGEDNSEDMESCVSEPEHTLPDGSSLGGAPIAGLPALSRTSRPYPMPPTPDLQTAP